jgi:hypothetical protein
MSAGAFVAMHDLAEEIAAERGAQYQRLFELEAEVATLRSIVRLLSDLSRIPEEWAGPDSKAPSAEVLRDVARVFAAFGPGTAPPEAEVDEDDGAVTLLWQRGREAFSLMLNGDGNVTGVVSPYGESYRTWTLPVLKADRIAIRLQDEPVSRLLRRE